MSSLRIQLGRDFAGVSLAEGHPKSLVLLDLLAGPFTTKHKFVERMIYGV